jgi:hypothetical protein
VSTLQDAWDLILIIVVIITNGAGDVHVLSLIAIIIFFKNFKFKYYNILYFSYMEAQDKAELITEVNKQRLAENIKALGEPEKDIITGHFTFGYYS